MQRQMGMSFIFVRSLFLHVLQKWSCVMHTVYNEAAVFTSRYVMFSYVKKGPIHKKNKYSLVIFGTNQHF